MNNLLLLPALVMRIEGKAPPTRCDIVNWSPPMKGLIDLLVNIQSTCDIRVSYR